MKKIYIVQVKHYINRNIIEYSHCNMDKPLQDLCNKVVTLAYLRKFFIREYLFIKFRSYYAVILYGQNKTKLFDKHSLHFKFSSQKFTLEDPPLNRIKLLWPEVILFSRVHSFTNRSQASAPNMLKSSIKGPSSIKNFTRHFKFVL